MQVNLSEFYICHVNILLAPSTFKIDNRRPGFSHHFCCTFPLYLLMRLQIQIWTKTQLENIKTVSQWRGGRWWQAWSEWRHWQNLKRCFCGKWQNLAQTLKLDVKGIELRTPNVQEDKKISRGWGVGGGIRIKWRIQSEDVCSAKFSSPTASTRIKVAYSVGGTTVESKDYYLFTLQLSSGLSKVEPSVKIVLKTGVENTGRKIQPNLLQNFQFWVNLTRISPLYASSRNWMWGFEQRFKMLKLP